MKQKNNELNLEDVLTSTKSTSEQTFEMVKYLIDAGVDINYTPKNSNATPLCYAIMSANLNTTKLLLEKGANPNNVIPKTGTTPTDTLALHLNNEGGLMSKAEDWIKLFLKHGANFNKISENKLKNTPLDKLSDEGKKVYDQVMANESKPKM